MHEETERGKSKKKKEARKKNHAGEKRPKEADENCTEEKHQRSENTRFGLT